MPVPDLRSGTPLRTAAEAMADGPLTYLLGAGTSVSAGLPTWGVLLRRLLTARGLETTAVDRLLNAQDNLLVAEAAFVPNTRRDVRERRIFSALYGTTDTAVAAADYTPSSMHLAVAEDAVRRGPGSATVMTLNYDDLQEEALVSVVSRRRWHDPAERVHGRGDATNRAASDQFEVHHLHGLLPRESMKAIGDRLVLTLSDYTPIMDASWQRTQVCDAVQRGPTLLIGTSYSDPDIRTWLGSLRPRERRKLLAVVSRSAFGLNRSQMDKVRAVMVSQWQSIGVEVHVVDDYATPTQIVRELGAVNQAGYQPPAARVAPVLVNRLSTFDDFQEADAHVLANQARRLATTLGDDTTFTLWLHDGERELVRWASSDRTYRSPKALRRIDVDPDSAWIVAQAVSSGTEVIQDIDVRTTELGGDAMSKGHGMTTGRWVMVAARPLVSRMPGGPPVTIGALSVASTLAKAHVDQDALQLGLDRACAQWATTLRQT